MNNIQNGGHQTPPPKVKAEKKKKETSPVTSPIKSLAAIQNEDNRSDNLVWRSTRESTNKRTNPLPDDEKLQSSQSRPRKVRRFGSHSSLHQELNEEQLKIERSFDFDDEIQITPTPAKRKNNQNISDPNLVKKNVNNNVNNKQSIDLCEIDLSPKKEENSSTPSSRFYGNFKAKETNDSKLKTPFLNLLGGDEQSQPDDVIAHEVQPVINKQWMDAQFAISEQTIKIQSKDQIVKRKEELEKRKLLFCLFIFLLFILITNYYRKKNVVETVVREKEEREKLNAGDCEHCKKVSKY